MRDTKEPLNDVISPRDSGERRDEDINVHNTRYMEPNQDISHFVPHRGSLLMIDRLLEWQEDSVVVQLRVPADSLFHDQVGVPSWIGVEYMAQAIAAWAGKRARNNGGEPCIGFLLGTRRYLAHVEYFRSGSLLRVEAQRELMGNNGLGVFTCRILEDGTELAAANVSVFEPPDPMGYLQSTLKPSRPEQ